MSETTIQHLFTGREGNSMFCDPETAMYDVSTYTVATYIQSCFKCIYYTLCKRNENQAGPLAKRSLLFQQHAKTIIQSDNLQYI